MKFNFQATANLKQIHTLLNVIYWLLIISNVGQWMLRSIQSLIYHFIHLKLQAKDISLDFSFRLKP